MPREEPVTSATFPESSTRTPIRLPRQPALPFRREVPQWHDRHLTTEWVIHDWFLNDAPLAEIVAGRKRFEFRLGFRRLACDSVREGDLLLRALGGNGVPFFVIDRRYGVSGAQPTEVLLRALETARADGTQRSGSAR